MSKIFSASLQPTGTVDTSGNYCEYQWVESNEEDTNYSEADAYVKDIILEDNLEIIDNVEVHNKPAGAIVVGQNGKPMIMFWAENDENEFGTVTFEGKTYTLTQNAYVGGDGTVYFASAVDAEGNEYEITWETTEEWDEAQEHYKETGEVASFAEDEANACDWDNPVGVEKI